MARKSGRRCFLTRKKGKKKCSTKPPCSEPVYDEVLSAFSGEPFQENPVVEVSQDFDVGASVDESSSITDLNERQNQTTADGDILKSVSTDHCYFSDDPTSIVNRSPELFVPPLEVKTLFELYSDVKRKVDPFLHRRWISVIDGNVFRMIYLSAQNNVSIQRSLEFSPDGEVELYVHCQKLSVDPYLKDSMPPIPLEYDTVNDFVDRVVCIINNVRKMEICSGYDEEKYQAGWASCPYGEIDKNPYQECRYSETFRSLSCITLVSSSKWRCQECTKLGKALKRRALGAEMDSRPICTNDKFLTEEQKLKKLMDQRQKIRNIKQQVSRQHLKMQEMIRKSGIQVEQTMSDELQEILKESDKVTPAQSVFLQQQVKASQQKNACGMRWHPTMVRFALAIHLTSPSAYELIRDTGMIKLPSSRTLFDYSHANAVKEGIDDVVIKRLAEKNETLTNEINNITGEKCLYKKYHVLMADEMHISQNLVFQKSSGRLVGFTSLDDLDREIKTLEQHLDNPDKELEETMASKIMVFMVKGVSNGLKEVVATYGCSNVSTNQMHMWTWRVIAALERSGVAVIAFVSDGCSINRSFIKKHKPATLHPSGVIFDTWNKCARGRKLFFISDVPHLLKTIRNCFLNSRWDKLKSRRRMKKNGKRYLMGFHNKTVQCNYARMKVKYAAEVLSATVCKDMRSQGWYETTETSLFIEKVNDWFDCLNGAHTSIAKKKMNPNLAAYTSVNDSRFDLLEDFLHYLDTWQAESENHNQSCASNLDGSEAADNPVDGDVSEIEDTPEEFTPASRRQLSRETLEGVRMTTLAFKPLIQFLLGEGTQFINARIFTQDPLEQFFSKIRAGHGGSRNPNLNQGLNKIRGLGDLGELGMRKRKGNAGEDGSRVEVTTEPLAKRKYNRIPKFLAEC
ncbi:Transposable element P transposase [Frankliniella fusca]|uniref:Transposable element P transposase n=1 Tax=Frankliniella fusca TaxID=407009 RepID=A0AAE1LP80_9NEOP|nr:Transposable element P transposase [Frankliniella fusca]